MARHTGSECYCEFRARFVRGGTERFTLYSINYLRAVPVEDQFTIRVPGVRRTGRTNIVLMKPILHVFKLEWKLYGSMGYPVSMAEDRMSILDMPQLDAQ